MKKSILLFCVFMLPLTLASDTYRRLPLTLDDRAQRHQLVKVYINVDGDDEQAVNTVESHLKRELRFKGADVVSNDDDWEYIIKISVMAMEGKDGTKTGNFTIANNMATRLPEFMYNIPEHYERFQSTYDGTLEVSYYPREELHEYCINTVNFFYKNRLFPAMIDRIKRGN